MTNFDNLVLEYIGKINLLIVIISFGYGSIAYYRRKSFEKISIYYIKLYELAKELERLTIDLSLILQYLNAQEVNRKQKLAVCAVVSVEFYHKLQNNLKDRKSVV